MTKKALFVLPLLAALLLIVFWQPIMGSLLGTCLNRYCLQHFGGELQSQSIHKQDGFWVIEKPCLDKKNTHITAERLLIGFGLKPLKREIDLEVIVEDSQMELGGELSNLEEALSDTLLKSLPYWLLKSNSSFLLNDGVVSWYRESNGLREKQEANFHFSAKSDSDYKEAYLTLLLDGVRGDSNLFELKISKKEEASLQAELTFREVECRQLSQIYETLGHPLQGWRLEEGNIQGHISLVLPENDRPYAWGDATLKGLVFEHPQKKIVGEIKEAKLDLETDRENKRTFPVFGKVVISDEASLALHRGGIPFWEIKNFLGGIYFLQDQEVKISFEGLCQHHEHSFLLTAEGDARFYDETQASLDVLFRLTNSNRQEAAAHFVARQLGAFCNCAEVELKNIGSREFNFIQTAFGKYFPDWQSLHMYEGKIDASGIAYMQKYRLVELKIDNIIAQGLQFDYDPLDISFSVGDASGDFSINLAAPNPLESIDGDFSITKGNLKFPGFNDTTLLLQDIETNLAIRKGVFQKSEMQGKLAGLKGTIVVDWLSKEEAVQLNFSGDAENLFVLAPDVIRKGMEKTFLKNRVNLIAGMSWKSFGAAVNGTLRLFLDSTDAGDTITFGFDIEKSSEALWKGWPADNLAISYWKNAGLEALQTVLPPIVSPSVLLETNWIKSESGIAGLVLRKGWFQADNLSLKKYLSPFVFQKDQMQLTGQGHFKGVFDHSRMTVEYVGENVFLENKYLIMEVKHIDTLDDPEKHSKLYAAHYFDFEKGVHFGSIPLVNASYFDKNSGLLFTDINAYITFEGQKVHLSDVEAQCNGIYFSGAIDADFDFPGDGVYEVEIRSHKLVGKVSQVQHLLYHFNTDFFFLNIPLEGDVTYRQKGGYLHFSFQPEDFEVKADVSGMISNGIMTSENTDTVLKDVKMNFAYNHENNSLEFFDIQGTLQMEGAQRGEEYILAGDYIRFDDYKRNVAEFDVWLGDQTRDVMRLVGKTVPKKEREGSHLIDFQINTDLTHFGDVHPSTFRLVMKESLEIEAFQLGLNMRLNTVLHDLQRFSPLGSLFFSRSLARGISSIKNASGKLRIDLRRDKRSSKFVYHIKGDEVAINDYAFEKCRLKGSASGDRWLIDELQLDELLLSANIEQKKDEWNANELSFRYGQSIHLELEKGGVEKENTFKAHVKHLEINLSELKERTAFDDFIKEYSPYGLLTATGEISFAFIKTSPYWRVEAILDSNVKSWGIKGLRFQDVQNVSCHFVSDKGITLRNLNTSLLEPKNDAVRSQVKIEKAHCEFLNGEFQFDGLYFNAPSHHLPWLADNLSQAFPDLIGPSIADVIRDIKLQGHLEGTAQFEVAPPYMALRLTLNDGRYHFLNSEHDLEQFVLEYDPFEFKVQSKYDLGEHGVRLYARSTSPTLLNGELLLTSLEPEEVSDTESKDTLFVNWENDPVYGFFIQKTQGKFAGLTMQLERDSTQPLSEEAMFLVGEVTVDAQEAKPFFSEGVAKKVEEWQVGDGYLLRGKWRLQKDSTQDYSNKLHFFGTLEGKNFIFRGYQFDALASHLEYTPSSIRIRDLHVNDASGTLLAEQIDVAKKSEELWEFSMPLMKVNKFRPSLLREAGMPRPGARKPLIVRELVLEDCKGDFPDPSTFVGHGNLYFTNRSAKLLQNTIFFIPAEILSRIGLDLSVLTPITGTINYTLQDGQIFLTKFKDIYSEGKLSKFFLSNSSPSFLDFDGNLNVKVRMKQNNLLFKLAELFTVTIQGNLQKPTYSLQKHRRENIASQK